MAEHHLGEYFDQQGRHRLRVQAQRLDRCPIADLQGRHVRDVQKNTTFQKGSELSQ